MRIVYFTHSLLSDWNHGNAHFLRGVATELIARGHDVTICEPRMGWSLANLVAHHGTAPIARFHRKYPMLDSVPYDLDTIDLDATLDGAELVIVHEWNEPELVARIGRHRRRRGGYLLLFHDTHHRSASAPHELAAYDLRHYDAVLAFGDCIRDAYLRHHWAREAFTWHEAADVRVFQPMPGAEKAGDVAWIGNWGDGERGDELRQLLIGPIATLGLRACVHGVRYPDDALEELDRAGIAYGGWIANHDVPVLFGRYRATVHLPRRPYVDALPGIPTIRVFEALACGVPLVCTTWHESEALFTPGEDFLMARTPREMRRHLRTVCFDDDAAAELAERGRRTILERHTCAHRVDELLAICAYMGLQPATPPMPAKPATPPKPPKPVTPSNPAATPSARTVPTH